MILSYNEEKPPKVFNPIKVSITFDTNEEIDDLYYSLCTSKHNFLYMYGRYDNKTTEKSTTDRLIDFLKELKYNVTNK
jgi:hypothetical protein